MSLWLKALTLWCVILILAVLNGALREKLLAPAIGGTPGYVASGIILSACIFLVAFAGVPWYKQLSSRQWLLVGLFWLILTLLFEFSFGRLIQHKPWPDLLEAYTFKGGDIWPLVLAVTLIAPWCAAKVRGAI